MVMTISMSKALNESSNQRIQSHIDLTLILIHIKWIESFSLSFIRNPIYCTLLSVKNRLVMIGIRNKLSAHTMLSAINCIRLLLSHLTILNSVFGVFFHSISFLFTFLSLLLDLHFSTRIIYDLVSYHVHHKVFYLSNFIKHVPKFIQTYFWRSPLKYIRVC